MNDFDIVIVGGGMVGLSIACALNHLPIKIAVIDEKGFTPVTLSDTPGLRVSAINASSQHYFSQIGIWEQLIASQRVLGFQSIAVKEKQNFAHLSANSADYQRNNLGYMIENQIIQNCLYNKVSQCTNIELFLDNATAIHYASDRAFVTLKNNTVLATKLIIGADGANSWVRNYSNLKMLQRVYHHHALITTVESQSVHNNCARQLFYPDGIVAFLPLWKPNLNCLVWSLKPNQAMDMLAMRPESFTQQLSAITDGWLGDYQLVNERKVFPLVARYCPQFSMTRTVLIGDAAHTIHPLAGQGANLGFRDAKQLAMIIEQCILSRQGVGLKKHLLKYQLSRQKDVVSMMAAMRIIHNSFDGHSPFKKLIRGIGMNMIDKTSFIKTPLIEYALGL